MFMSARTLSVASWHRRSSAAFNACGPSSAAQVASSVAVRKARSSRSEIERIFKMAVQNEATLIAHEEFRKPENQEKIRALVVEAWEKTITGDKKDALIDKLSEAIARGFGGDRY